MFLKKKPLSKTRFSEKFVKQLIKKVKGLKVISINELEVKSEFNEVKHQHFLNNAYSEYVKDVKSIKDIIEKDTINLFEQVKEWKIKTLKNGNMIFKSKRKMRKVFCF